MTSSVDPDSARFLRQRVLDGFGRDAQVRLADARVVVIGAGGLGSAIIPALAAAGVGTLVLVDDDTVEASNLARQTIHGVADIGRFKVDSAMEAVARLSPDTTVIAHRERFTGANSGELLAAAHLLVDGSDNFATRYLANDAAAIRGIPLVWGSAARYSGQVGVASDRDGVDYRDLFPDEPAESAALSCDLVGVLPTVCGVIGAMMAGEALKLLAGLGTPLLGRVAVFDALSGSTREIEYRRDPAADRAATPRPPRPAQLDDNTSVTPTALRVLLDAGDVAPPPVLLDVREPWEAELVSLPGAILIPLGELAGRLDELDRDASILAYCHHGSRSQRALELLRGAGFRHASHLGGGIDAWAREVDPGLVRY